MLEMSSMMGQLGGGGGPFGAPPPRGPGLFGMAPPPANPGSPTSTAAPGAPGTTPGANSIFDPAMMQQMMSAFGGGADGAPAANPFGAFGIPPFGGAGAFGAPASPADSRPPEVRFETQLQANLHQISHKLVCSIFPNSNCKIWVSLTPRKTFGPC